MKGASAMPAIKYIIDLSDEEREQLREITRRGRSPARKLKRAMILLKADEGFDDGEIAQMVDTCHSGPHPQALCGRGPFDGPY